MAIDCVAMHLSPVFSLFELQAGSLGQECIKSSKPFLIPPFHPDLLTSFDSIKTNLWPLMVASSVSARMKAMEWSLEWVTLSVCDKRANCSTLKELIALSR